MLGKPAWSRLQDKIQIEKAVAPFSKMELTINSTQKELASMAEEIENIEINFWWEGLLERSTA